MIWWILYGICGAAACGAAWNGMGRKSNTIKRWDMVGLALVMAFWPFITAWAIGMSVADCSRKKAAETSDRRERASKIATLEEIDEHGADMRKREENDSVH